MSRNRKITSAVVAVAALALLSSIAIAAPKQAPMMMKRGGGMDRMECRMDGRGMGPAFTTEQKEQMEEIRASFEDERVELQNKLKVLHLEMADLSEGDNPDFGKMERMIDEMSDLRAQVMKLRLRQHQAIRNILDDDQRVLFDRGIARKVAGGGHGGMRGGRMDCHPGGMRGGRSGCRPGGMTGARMGGRPGGMMGGRGPCSAMGFGPGDQEECIIIMKGDAGMMGEHMDFDFEGGEHMTWETEDGKRVEVFKMAGDESGEGRVIVKKIVDGDEIILEVETDEDK